MTERILDISDRPAYLSVQNSLLVIRFPSVAPVSPQAKNVGNADIAATAEQVENAATGGTEYKRPRDPESGLRARDTQSQTVPLADIAALIVSHPQVSYTHAVLAGLAAAGATFIACDEKHLPAAMLLPLVSHSTQTERFAVQAQLSLPTRKRIWQEIVRTKLLSQARLLEERTGKDWGLVPLASRVRSGDAGNLESQAARIYWRALFGDFTRDPEGEGVNSCLNYGYAVVRAIVARALCGAGLHPSFGVHHHNRYDAFCLADDIMEPYRPLTDRVVARLRDERGPEVSLDKESKRAILESLLIRYEAEGESRTLFDWANRAATSLTAVIEGRADKLETPLLIPYRQPMEAES
ncbi:MAG: type II CRISPR-associated endonuclease Cas1 [Terriglobia bacterium]